MNRLSRTSVDSRKEALKWLSRALAAVKGGDRTYQARKSRPWAVKGRMWLAGGLLALLWTTPAIADNRFIVRATLGPTALGQFCFLQKCAVVGRLHGSLNPIFIFPTPHTV